MERVTKNEGILLCILSINKFCTEKNAPTPNLLVPFLRESHYITIIQYIKTKMGHHFTNTQSIFITLH